MFESAFAIGERTINPESQKIGIDTKKPVRAKASSSLPFPKSLRNVYAIRFAAPEISKTRPIITPNPMMIPMLPNVPPKPLVMELMILTPALASPAASTTSVGVSGIPPMMPIIIVLIIRARKVCTFVFSTSIISRVMPITKPISMRIPSISIVCPSKQ